nr:transporter substrate-binding domain-containing protein [Pseudoalteromonas caenipelagi]
MWLLFLSPISLVAAEPLKVAFGQSRPPYVDESSQSGISVELFEQIAQSLNWQYQSIFVSNRRMERLLKTGSVDIAVEVQQVNEHVYYSLPFISYSNFAIHSSKSKFSISTIEQLSQYSICAWQNAKQHLNIETVIAEKRDYSEYSKQQEQVIDWLAGKCQVILIDDTLLNWHLIQLRDGRYRYSNASWGKVLLPVKNNPLWFYVGFRDKGLRDRFNIALQQLKGSGRYELIRSKYNRAQ